MALLNRNIAVSKLINALLNSVLGEKAYIDELEE